MEGHETKLKLAFSDLDRNKDGKVNNCTISFILKVGILDFDAYL